MIDAPPPSPLTAQDDPTWLNPATIKAAIIGTATDGQSHLLQGRRSDIKRLEQHAVGGSA